MLIILSDPQANRMKCFARYPFFQNKVWKERNREAGKKKGPQEEWTGGLSTEPNLCVQLQLLRCFRKDLLTWECHNVPGRVGTLLTGQVRMVSTHKHAQIQHMDTSCTKRSGLILCERQNLRTEITCQCDTSVIFNTLLLLLKAAENLLEFCYCWHASSSTSTS